MITKKQKRSSRAYYQNKSVAMAHFGSNQPLSREMLKTDNSIMKMLKNLFNFGRKKK